MRGRLNFGLSFAFDFDYLLIDESLSAGDASFKDKTKKMLKKKVEESQVLLVSHSMATLKEMCQMGILLHEEKIHYFDDIDDAVKMYEDINKKVRKK